MIELFGILNYESDKNLLLIEEDFLTKKTYVTLLHSPNLVKKWNMEHISNKLLQYQKEYYEEYFVPMQLERNIYDNYSEKKIKHREYHKYSKKEFMTIYRLLTFQIDIDYGMISSSTTNDLYEETIYKRFDYFKVDKELEKINKKEYILLKNEKRLFLEDGEEIYKPLFSIKNKRIQNNIPNSIKEVFKMYFDDLIDYIMLWVNEFEKEKKIKKEIIKEYIADIKEELYQIDNKIIYRIKNHKMSLKNEYKYLNEKSRTENKISNIYKIVIDNDCVRFLKEN